jgi:hypothetical protein
VLLGGSSSGAGAGAVSAVDARVAEEQRMTMLTDAAGRLAPESRAVLVTRVVSGSEEAGSREALFGATLDALPEAERRAMHDKMRAEWDGLSDAQKRQLKDERKAMMGHITPQERAQMREERRKAFEKMTPEERKKWRDEMHHSHRGDGPHPDMGPGMGHGFGHGMGPGMGPRPSPRTPDAG